MSSKKIVKASCVTPGMEKRNGVNDFVFWPYESFHNFFLKEKKKIVCWIF